MLPEAVGSRTRFLWSRGLFRRLMVCRPLGPPRADLSRPGSFVIGPPQFWRLFVSVPLSRDPHPLLDAQAFVAVFPASLESVPTPDSVLAGFAEDYEAPFSTDDDVKRIVRDLFRHAGFKPTGRSKPASEYLIKAQAGGFLSSINVVVDACNVASLWSGLPISVVDLDVAVAPYRVGVAEPRRRRRADAPEPRAPRLARVRLGRRRQLARLQRLVDEQGHVPAHLVAHAAEERQRRRAQRRELPRAQKNRAPLLESVAPRPSQIARRGNTRCARARTG